MRIVRLILACLVGAVFIYAGAIKALNPLRFASDISNYALLPWSLGVRVAFYLPWLEIILGLALIAQRLFAGAIVLTGGLLLLFIGATIWARAQGIDVACGCFGTAGSNLTLTWHLVLNGSLFAALVALWCLQRQAPQSK
jgi:putative oxidoreductase